MINNINILAGFEAELTKVAEQYQPMQQQSMQQPSTQSKTDEAMDAAKATAIRAGVGIAKATAKDVMKKRRGNILDRMRDRKEKIMDAIAGVDRRPKGVGGVLRAAADSALTATGKAAEKSINKAAS